MPIPTDMSNLLVGFASMEARQAALALQLLEANAREDERLKSLERRLEERQAALERLLNERHASLGEKLDDRHERVEKLLESIIEGLAPVEKRLDELEQTKSKMSGILAAAGGGTVALSGVVAWLTDLLK